MLSRIARSGPPSFDRRYNPTEVFDFTKGTRGLLRGTALTCSGGVNGTVVDPSGNIVAASAPRITHDPMGVTNFCLQSERCDLSPWVGTATATAASEYFGRSQFWTFAKTTSAGSEGRGQQLRAMLAGESALITVALLAGSTTSVGLGFYGDTGVWGTNPNSTASVVSGPGSVTQSTGGLWNVTGLSATVPTLVTMRRVYPAADVMAYLYVYPGTAGSTTIGHSVKLAQPMVEYNLAARSGRYVPTTNVAASARDCLGLLVEPQSTNLFTKCRDLSHADWGAVANIVATRNQVGMDGQANSASLIARTSTTPSYIGQAQAKLVTGNAETYSLSGFAKPGTGAFLAVGIQSSGGSSFRASICFNLATGTVSSAAAALGFTSPSGNIQKLSNGWCFWWLTGTTDTIYATVTGFLSVLTATGAIDATDASSSANLTVDMVQLERSPVPTSRILTDTAEVTRTADVVEVTGSAVAAVFNPSGGTMLVEASIPAVVNSPGAGLLTAINVTPGSVDWLGISRYPTYSGVNRRRNSVDLASMSVSSTHVANTMERVALSYRSDGGNDQFAINGTLATPVASSTIPYTAVDTIRIGRFGSNPGWAGGTIKRASFWPTALSADVLQTLTT